MRTAQRLSLLFRLILRKVDSEWSLCIGGQLRADFSVREGGLFIQKRENELAKTKGNIKQKFLKVEISKKGKTPKAKRKRSELTKLVYIEKRKLLKPKEKEIRHIPPCPPHHSTGKLNRPD